MRVEFVAKCLTVYGMRQPGDVLDVSMAEARMLIDSGLARLATAKTETKNETKTATRARRRKS